MEEESTDQGNTLELIQNHPDSSELGRTERKESTPDCSEAGRLFITGGLRMDFLTPAVLLLVLGSSVAYAESSPSWWSMNSVPNRSISRYFYYFFQDS